MASRRVQEQALRHGGDGQRIAPRGGGAEKRHFRRCNHRRRLQADQELSAEHPKPLQLQRLQRNQRHERDPCRNHHRQARPLHGMEDHRRLIRVNPLCRLPHLLPRHVPAAATARHPAELYLLRQEPGQIRQDSYRLPPVLRRGQSPAAHPYRCGRQRKNRRVLAHAGFGQEPLHGVLRPPAGAATARSNHRGGNRPQGPRQPALRSVLPLPGLPSSGTTERPEP